MIFVCFALVVIHPCSNLGQICLYSRGRKNPAKLQPASLVKVLRRFLPLEVRRWSLHQASSHPKVLLSMIASYISIPLAH